jgi:hypothetical protein
MDLSSLLEVPEIQKELRLTDRQKEQLKTAGQRNSQSRDRYMQQLRAGGGRPDRTAMEALTTTLQQEADATIAGLLQASQRTRVQQIMLQARGPFAVGDADVATKLLMTPIQQEQVQTIIQQSQMQQSEARRAEFMSTRGRRGEDRQESTAKAEGETKGEGQDGTGGGRRNRSGTDEQAQTARDQAREQSQKIKEQAIQAIAKVLTSGQRNNFNRLLGAKFDFENVTLASGDSGGGRGGRGGSGGGPGGGRGGFGGGPGGGRP